MINSIIEGISAALNMEFGDDYKIYVEKKEQGLKEPCFFILSINPTHKLFLGTKDGRKRYFKENSFCIHYFPSDKLNPRTEIHSVCEQLEDCLEWITVDGDLIRGTQIHYEIEDDVLLFFINYDLFTYKTQEETAMDEFDLTQSVE
ncbi:MAG: hypothetical protein LUH07_09510 [Lachnospiraceae bacterium]|nr:hypothetical protein [Lachnospiraceae bacterium]